MPKEMVTVYNPAGVKPPVTELPAAPRIDGLRGKSMGIIWNEKPGGDILLAQVEKRLKEAFGVSSFWSLKHPGGRISDEMLRELSEKCDFVLNGIGDWGACTTWSVHAAIELEKQGLPVATFCTEEFESLGRAQVKMLGRPMLPIVKVPHPIGGMPQAMVEQYADDAMERVVEVLTGSKERAKAASP